MHLNKQKTSRLAAGLALAALGVPCLQAQVTAIPSTYVLPASAAVTSQPGFIWNVSEVLNSEPNSLAWAEAQLAGMEGVNYADPTASGIATGQAQPANPATAPISFVGLPRKNGQ